MPVKQHALSLYVNTTNTGIAAHVFRCLVNALSCLMNGELVRLHETAEVCKIDCWDDKGERINLPISVAFFINGTFKVFQECYKH
jgi:hypothetical protein